MRRFWTAVDVTAVEHGWGIALDGRPVRTPAGAALAVPARGLADAIAAEWSAVEGAVDPRQMRLTGLANAAIDRIAADPAGFAGQLARYAEADLACYRAEGPRPLVDLQARHWDPLLAWARRRFDIDFQVTTGLIPVDQPAATVDRLRHELARLDPFRLAGLSPLVTIGGSLLAALAVLERAVSDAEAWEAVSVDDRFQIEQWGADDEAVASLEARRTEFAAAARFLALLDG